MLRVNMFANGTFAIAFDIFNGEQYFGHIEYLRRTGEFRFQHRSGMIFHNELVMNAVMKAKETVIDLAIEDEVLS